jgi:hypothetical protein
MVAEGGTILTPEGIRSPESTRTQKRSNDNDLCEGDLGYEDVEGITDILKRMGESAEAIALVVRKGIYGKVLVNALGDPAKEEKAAKICAELKLSILGGHRMTEMAKASWEPKSATSEKPGREAPKPSPGAKVEHSPKIPKPTEGAKLTSRQYQTYGIAMHIWVHSHSKAIAGLIAEIINAPNKDWGAEYNALSEADKTLDTKLAAQAFASADASVQSDLMSPERRMTQGSPSVLQIIAHLGKKIERSTEDNNAGLLVQFLARPPVEYSADLVDEVAEIKFAHDRMARLGVCHKEDGTILRTALYRSVSELQNRPEHFTTLTARVAELKRKKAGAPELMEELEGIAEDLRLIPDAIVDDEAMEERVFYDQMVACAEQAGELPPEGASRPTKDQP